MQARVARLWAGAGLVIVAATAIPVGAVPAGTAFTYQGRLTDGGVPASGTYDLLMELRDAATDPSVALGTLTLADVPVQNGLFTVELNFGAAAFEGDARWLAIFVRPGASSGVYTPLMPRQRLNPTPYAITADKLSVPSSASGASNQGLVDTGLFSIFQEGTAAAMMAVASGDGTGLISRAYGDGDAIFARSHGGPSSGAAVHAESDNFRAGSFEISNASNPHIAMFATTNGSGHAIQGYGTGTGKAIGGYQNGTSGEAGFFQIGNQANDSAAVHARTIGDGPAIVAESDGGGPALEIKSGPIKVTGAGLNTNTAVFRHRVTASNIGDHTVDDIWYETTIDHPLCNNHPDALLIVTDVATGGDVHVRACSLSVRYNGSNGRWIIHAAGNGTVGEGGDFEIGDEVNVLVFHP